METELQALRELVVQLKTENGSLGQEQRDAQPGSVGSYGVPPPCRTSSVVSVSLVHLLKS